MKARGVPSKPRDVVVPPARSTCASGAPPPPLSLSHFFVVHNRFATDLISSVDSFFGSCR